MTQAELVYLALGTGPKRVAEIVEITGLRSGTASRAAQTLVARGVAVRLNDGERCLTYARVGDKGALKRRNYGRAYEQRYCDLRALAISSAEAASRLGLAPTTAEKFEEWYRAQTFAGCDADSSSPKFSDDTLHLSRIAAANGGYGFPVLANVPPRYRVAA